MDVALATCARLPEPDFDEKPLLDALRARGFEAGSLAWDDPEVEWSRPRLTLLRSTWNYPWHPDAFRAWAERTASVTALWNPWPAVRWNVHKGYLLDLERAGVPVAPTELVRCGESRTLASIVVERGWDDVVVKPAVSAASFRTMRVRDGDLGAGEAHLAGLVRGRDVLVQRYLPSVEDHGERALVWVDGQLTHAVRKSPRFDGEDESVSDAVPISEAEAALARRALAVVETELLYARIDVAPGPDGDPVVMELELIEPSLFFRQGPAALERIVTGIERRLER